MASDSDTPARADCARSARLNWLFESDSVVVERFLCPPSEPAWQRENEISLGPLIVFPGVPVSITHAGREPFIGESNTIAFYNHGQVYRRGLLSSVGDDCTVLWLDPSIVQEIARPWAKHLRDDPCRPFPMTCGPCPPELCLAATLLRSSLESSAQPDRLEIEESVVGLAGPAIEAAFACECGKRDRAERVDTRAAHRELVNDTKSLVATRYSERLTLQQIARAVHSSPYHLARTFKAHEGVSIHTFLTQTRLRASLRPLADGVENLAGLALRLGFSSHAHFSDLFRRTFGLPPSAVRGAACAGSMAQMSTILKASPGSAG